MREIVTFFLSGKVYGADVSHIQGIENYEVPVSVPDMPEKLQGFVTIRDEILPVVDIKKQLVLPHVDVTSETKYVVLRTERGKVAVVVDGVSNLIKAEGENVQDIPKILKGERTSYVEFVVKQDNHLILAISGEDFLSMEDWKLVQKLISEMQTGGSDD